MLHALDFNNYKSTVRASHDLAGLLKRTKPQFLQEIDELQQIVNRAQLQLDQTKVHGEALAAWNDLEVAYNALQQLTHHREKSERV